MVENPLAIMIRCKREAAKAHKILATAKVNELRSPGCQVPAYLRLQKEAMDAQAAYLNACYALYGREANSEDAYRYRAQMLELALEMAVTETDRIICG